MGAIRHRGSTPSPVEYLYQSHTIGRAPGCELVLQRRAISGHHATIRWADGVWTLRDLGSRNGTFINEQRLGGASERAQPLAVGDLLTFAVNEEVWEVTDTSEPRPLLIPLDTQAPPIELDAHDVLALPSTEEPLWTIYQRRSRWQLERNGDCSDLADRQELNLNNRRYRLMITGAMLATTDAKSVPVPRRVEDLALDIRVTRDEESASLAARFGAETYEMPQRTFFYLLAFLARHRLGQVESRESSAGWVDVETTCHELGLATPEALGLLVHRCRKAMKACKLEDPAAIIDRSRRGQLRIGVEPEQLSVTRIQ